MGKERREWNELKFEDFQGFLEEFQRESDRAAPVLGHAYLDESLRQLIAASLVNKPKEVRQLFRTGGPLGSFSSRLDTSYCMGLISEDEYRDLTVINKIRNRFAHDLQGLSFTDDWAVKMCGGLKQPYEAPKLLGSLKGSRVQFNVAVAMLSARLNLRILQQRKERRPEVPPPTQVHEPVR